MTSEQIFHRYRIVRRIARGGMAEVYMAMLRGPSGFEKPVALKKILPVYAGMQEFGVLFRDEARLTSLLEHSAIVQVYEFGSYDGEYFIAMEYVDGPDLEELLDRCRRRGILLPIEVVLHIAHSLSRAIEYAHEAVDEHQQPLHLIHRDVSPPNVLIGVQGEIKLTDFGVAKASAREAETRPGVLRGKYAYMSPEQVRQGPIDQRSDIFSIGTVVYEALTGVNPFEGTTDFQTMESVERAEVEPAGFLRPDTPAELDHILLACLEPDPDLRYQTASDLRRDLGAVLRAMRAEGSPDLTASFLRDVFPERTPEAESRGIAEEGAPSWEALAHRIPAMLVPIPHPKRERAPGQESRLVMDGDGDSGADTANEEPVRLAPEGSEPPEQVSMNDEIGSPLDGPVADEWGDDEDSIKTEPGVDLSQARAVAQLGPAERPEPPPLSVSLRPPGPRANPGPSVEEAAAQLLASSPEASTGSIPVFNEWDDEDSFDPLDWSVRNETPDMLSTGRLPLLGRGEPLESLSPLTPSAPVRAVRGPARLPAADAAAPGPLSEESTAVAVRSPARGRPLPPRSTTEASGQSFGGPARPSLLAPPLPPPEAGEAPSPSVAPPPRPALHLVPDLPEIPAPPPPPPPRPAPPQPPWARATWVAIAVLLPLLFVFGFDWLRARQQEAKAPSSTAPLERSLEPAPPKKRVEPLPPTEPQAPADPQRSRP